MKTVVNLSCIEAMYSQTEAISLVAEAGFAGCFINATRSGADIPPIAKRCREEGLFVQSVHAPFDSIHIHWEDNEAGAHALDALETYASLCAEAGAPIMICHVWKGFGEQHPTEIGIERLARLLNRAEALGIKIAFENTEGEEYLGKVIQNLGGHKAAGFCIDTGHEICYNRGRNMIGLFGEKLICTHFNDNLGVTGPEILWHDDAHMLPFDGLCDWEGIARRLKAVGYAGDCTLELTTANRPNRHTHDGYPADARAFLHLAHERAERIVTLMQKED